MTESETQPTQQVPMAIREDYPMRVSSKTNVHKLASAITNALRSHSRVTLSMLGSGPTQQAMKAWTVSCAQMRQQGWDVIGRPSMEDEEESGRGKLGTGKVVTVVRISLEKRRI